MRARNALATLAALAALLPLHAQSGKELQLYKVEINFHDGTDTGAATDRRYSFLAMESRKAVFKVGSKSPAVTGSIVPQTGNALASTEYTYLDVGVNIECFIQAAGSKAAMHGSLDLSNITGDAQLVSGVRNPIIRQTKLDFDTILESGKPTVLATIDDPLTARKLQVEVTVTKVN
jgi:hypothetical protein